MKDAELRGAHTPLDGPVEVWIGRIRVVTQADGRTPSQLAAHYHRHYGFERIRIAATPGRAEFIGVYGEGREGIQVRRYPIRNAEVLPFPGKKGRRQARR